MTGTFSLRQLDLWYASWIVYSTGWFFQMIPPRKVLSSPPRHKRWQSFFQLLKLKSFFLLGGPLPYLELFWVGSFEKITLYEKKNGERVLVCVFTLSCGRWLVVGRKNPSGWVGEAHWGGEGAIGAGKADRTVGLLLVENAVLFTWTDWDFSSKSERL